MDIFKDFPVFASFLAGIASFVSPCVLPLVPAYISFITGQSLDELKSGRGRIKSAFLNSLFFVMGFTFVFVILGASATYIGSTLGKYKYILEKAGGIVIILFALHILGVFKLKFLYSEKRFEIKKYSLGYLGSFLVGIAFSFGWTPCIGPILSSILILASAQNTLSKGMILLVSYSIGLGIPFLITALFIRWALAFFTKIKKYFLIIEMASGAILLALGILLLTDTFKFVSGFISFLY